MGGGACFMLPLAAPAAGVLPPSEPRSAVGKRKGAQAHAPPPREEVHYDPAEFAPAEQQQQQDEKAPCIEEEQRGSQRTRRQQGKAPATGQAGGRKRRGGQGAPDAAEQQQQQQQHQDQQQQQEQDGDESSSSSEDGGEGLVQERQAVADAATQAALAAIGEQSWEEFCGKLEASAAAAGGARGGKRARRALSSSAARLTDVLNKNNRWARALQQGGLGSMRQQGRWCHRIACELGWGCCPLAPAPHPPPARLRPGSTTPSLLPPTKSHECRLSSKSDTVHRCLLCALVCAALRSSTCPQPATPGPLHPLISALHPRRAATKKRRQELLAQQAGNKLLGRWSALSPQDHAWYLGCQGEKGQAEEARVRGGR